MTENEAKLLEKLDNLANDSEIDMYSVATLNAYFEECGNTIRKLIEEIQQYRAIGTVKGYERAIQISIENYNLYKEYKAKVQEFEAIGTVEECRNAVNLIRPRKPYKGSFGVLLCSLCGEKVGQMVTKTEKTDCMNFCANCGSLIDWSE